MTPREPDDADADGDDGDDCDDDAGAIAASHDFLRNVIERAPNTGYLYKTFVREPRAGGGYNDDYDEELLRVKITIVGAGNVGKTAFLRRFAERVSFESVATRNMTVRAGEFTLPLLTRHPFYDRRALVFLWDTPGQTQYLPMAISSLTNADGVIIMFDAANDETMREVAPWRKRIEHSCPNATVLLAASRSDLYNDETRTWLSKSIDEIARAASCDAGHVVCSALRDRVDQIDAVFLSLIDRAIAKRAALNADERTSPRFDTVDLHAAAADAARARSKTKCGC